MLFTHTRSLSVLFLLLTLVLVPNVKAESEKAMKEWTFLIFLNGNNNLDPYGAQDINEMEQVGSTDNLNVVVQWASIENGNVRRVYVQKDNDTSKVTSPVVETVNADMGDWHHLVDFVKWGAKNYPAKHYFVNVWDHGSGWHLKMFDAVGTRDISWDDKTGHYMTTEQLGQAIREASAAIGQKIDIYGSDACLMAMAEVAGEMGEAVDVFVGSEEVEPLKGWPYDGLLKGWAALGANATAADIGKILVAEYTKSYQGGTQGSDQVALSAFDLNKFGKLNQAMKNFGTQIRKLDKSDRSKVVSAASEAQKFTYGDYGDLLDFVGLLDKKLGSSVDRASFNEVRNAAGEFIIANSVTEQYKKATGLAIWMPYSKSSYNWYSKRYQALHFNQNSGWGDALAHFLQDTN